MPRTTDNDTLTADIKVASDLIGLALMYSMFRSKDAKVRRIGAATTVMSGIDGVVKLLAVRPITPVQAAYQVPWVILGAVACRWLVNPPRLGS